MSIHLEEQIRRYTELLDANAPPLSELVPEELRSAVEVGQDQGVGISLDLSTGRQRRRIPAWIYGVGAAAAVVLLAVPVWLFTSANREDTTAHPSTPTQTSDPGLAPADPFFRAESGGVATGSGWPPSSPITFAVNGAQGDAPFHTDVAGEFNFEVRSIGLSFEAGDTVTASDGITSRRILIPVLVVDVFSPEQGIASGTTDVPDETTIGLTIVGDDESGRIRSLETTVQTGRWTFDFEPVPPDQVITESWVTVQAGDGPYEVRVES